MSGFKKFDEKFPSKEKFYSSSIGKKINIKFMNMLLKFGIHLK